MKIDIYEPCDKAIQAMNRENVEAFGKLKMANWDKVHVIRTVAAVYNNSHKRARKRYYEVAFEAYVLAMLICGERANKAHELAEKAITEKWIDEILMQTDPVALYRFDSETERKAYRLAEALEVSPERNREIDKALKEWSRQLGQFAINVTDYAALMAYKDYGITEVEWISMEDARVCNECYAYDRQTFSIDEVPTKPHWGCRCVVVPKGKRDFIR